MGSLVESALPKKIEIYPTQIQATRHFTELFIPKKKFQKLKIEKVLSQNRVESAQTKWTTPLVFAPRKERIPSFLSLL